jgi:hypothetical protein
MRMTRADSKGISFRLLGGDCNPEQAVDELGWIFSYEKLPEGLLWKEVVKAGALQ